MATVARRTGRNWISSGAFTLSSHSSAADCRDVTPEQDASLYTTQLSDTTKTTESWTRRGKKSKRRSLRQHVKITPQTRRELKRCGCFSVASELMCVYENGNCGNFIQGFVTVFYPVCLLKRPLCLTHTNFSPLNTTVVDKRLFGLLTILILKINERYMRAFCHRKREEDWSHSSALNWLLYLFSIRQTLCTLKM